MSFDCNSPMSSADRREAAEFQSQEAEQLSALAAVVLSLNVGTERKAYVEERRARSSV